MGEIAAAAVVSHIPTLVLDEDVRVRLGGGRDTNLVPGMGRLRERLDGVGGIDTLVIIDTHWFTTTEHIVAGADHFAGVYTSEEMPRAICDVPYDYPGAPALARLIHEVGKERRVRTTNARNATCRSTTRPSTFSSTCTRESRSSPSGSARPRNQPTS